MMGCVCSIESERIGLVEEVHHLTEELHASFGRCTDWVKAKNPHAPAAAKRHRHKMRRYGASDVGLGLPQDIHASPASQVKRMSATYNAKFCELIGF